VTPTTISRAWLSEANSPFWAYDDALALAKGLKAALDLTGK
jgi:hypothetical protein